MKIPSQVYLIAAAVLAPAVFAARLLGGTFSALAFLVGGLVLLAFAFGMSVMINRLRDFSLRPARFSVSPTGFHTRPAMPPEIFVLIFSVAAAELLAIPLGRIREDGTGLMILTGMTVIFLAAATVTAIFTIGRDFVSLTPEGISWGRWLFRRRAGWDEVAPGSPSWPHPGERSLRLDTSAGRKSISALVDVDPRFLTSAIRWYAGHPEHRAGIGTQAEHDRLVRELQAAPV